MASDGDEVAEDYRLALEDLSSNMRFEISNLTVIARENTEHALAIAEVLQQHILKAPPGKKLPALYVMDSIVKNVGTPYTLYFGRNLFKTFMESYAVVDHGVRRKMEEMLKTWKDPVPGSLDTRPVFSHELVRPIENALMKARAASMPQQQQAQGPIPGRSRPNVFPPHRNTPTPPGGRGLPPGGYPQQQPMTNGHQQQQQHQQHQQLQQQTQHHHQQQLQQQPGPYGPAGPASAAPAGNSVENLSNDIQTLIVALKAEFSQNPHDASVQNRLRALLDLQGVVQHASLPSDQLELIKQKATPVHIPPPSSSSAFSIPVPVAPMPSVSAAPAAGGAGTDSVTLESLLGKGAMAALLSMRTAMSQNPGATAASTTMTTTTTTATTGANPQPSFGNVAIRSPAAVHADIPQAAPHPPPRTQPLAQLGAPGVAFSLMDQLRAAGMLPSVTSAPAPPPPAAMTGMPVLPASIANFLAAQRKEAAPSADVGGEIMIDVAALHQKRFRTDEEGKKKKTAHMDWHFKVHQRSSEAEKRGTHRSWYVDQQDWQRARESVDALHDTSATEASAPAAKAADAPQYMPVPEPSSGINTVCPICQDRFENKWLDTAQEWVWLDTVLVGKKAYHASCHAEATRDRDGDDLMPGAAGPGAGRRTPEPVLGKRKAELGLGSPKVRVQKTFV
ncbi:Uncharacterized protein ESCO_001400 [Escovopsis weberi]|uniref:CID domain-containing protein n=1 Tax=Escovopsis weberi TaxID=150374 RepID=A0A0M8MSP6_ESCWE|nr:Uncharacterized protein ESCO_001400 [Escovopsis weberi]